MFLHTALLYLEILANIFELFHEIDQEYPEKTVAFTPGNHRRICTHPVT